MKASVIIQIINLFQLEIKKEFSEDNINYVSPLRAHPKRYYMLDKAKLNLTLDTLDGDAVAEVLKDNRHITKNVNLWLKNFGVEVDVKGFKEVIHHLVVKQNNIDLDITDVGFGISQILPVIIQGFLSSKNSTTIIEQPEIHLHPKMQADLADLFIDIVKNTSGKRLIIETHSEYLLKRLRRRISEGIISPSDVSICLFNPQSKEKGATIDNLEIEDKGFFEWPIDFYGGEILKDTTEFLINQNN
jgi:predicted ATPase